MTSYSPQPALDDATHGDLDTPLVVDGTWTEIPEAAASAAVTSTPPPVPAEPLLVSLTEIGRWWGVSSERARCLLAEAGVEPVGRAPRSHALQFSAADVPRDRADLDTPETSSGTSGLVRHRAALRDHVDAAAALLTSTARTGHQLGQLRASWLISRCHSEQSRITYARDLQDFLLYCAQYSYDPLTIGIPETDAYKAWLITRPSRTGRPITERYIQRKIMSVSSFFEYLVEVDARDRNPVTRSLRRGPNYKKKYKALTPAQTRAVLTRGSVATRTIDAACILVVLELLFKVGLRVCEVARLDLDGLYWIDLPDGTRLQMIRFLGKGNQPHERSLPADLQQHAAAYLAQRPEPASPEHARAFLLDRNGRRLEPHQIAYLVQRAGELAELPGRLTTHAGRHTVKKTATDAGVPVEIMQRAFNHASLDTTASYGVIEMDAATDPAHVVAALVNVA